MGLLNACAEKSIHAWRSAFSALRKTCAWHPSSSHANHRHKSKNRLNQDGFTLAEVLISITLLALIMLSVSKAYLFISKQGVSTRDKAFAVQKCIQMMEEMRGLISNSDNSTIGVLDNYDDGATYNSILTTRKDITSPSDPLSGNARNRYVRRVSVLQIPNEPLARRVYVRVYSAGKLEPLAETVSILRTITSQYVPTQMYDLYVICVENVPGWWLALSTMRPVFDGIIEDLKTRNPGLELRVHWITRLAYGRDPYYTPAVNATSYTNNTDPDGVYFYPGLMQKSSPTQDFYYYAPDNISGRIDKDGTVVNTGNYTLADQYNNAVRYPDEERLYAEASAAAQAAGQPAPEISLRMLLERMNSSPDLLKNLLMVNLHGELLPMPPMRNYSDAAKDPSSTPQVRVVTHPQKLQYASGTEVRLRVYSYVMNPSSWAQDSTLNSMTVLISSPVAASNISVRKMIGNQSIDYAWTNASSGTDYTVTAVGSQTEIVLYNSPLRCAQNASNKGLPSTKWLYGLEYIPCEVGSPGNPNIVNSEFNEGVKDLSSNTPSTPKNTARWVIRFATGTLADGLYTVETRIGTDLTTGSSANKPENLSRTYFWVGINPPYTEQYQYIGDPRHMPYSDVKWNDGYNWYFCNVPNSDYQGYTKTADGWQGNSSASNGLINVDVPRFFQTYRNALLTTNGLWSNMTGYSFYYVGIGGEMGADSSNGFANGLPIMATPWNASGQGKIDEITNNSYGSGTQNSARIIAKDDNSWYSRYWLGELYPDTDFTTSWSVSGNLPLSTYYRAPFTTSFGGSTVFNFSPVKRSNERGSASLFNGNTTGTGNTYFNHEYRDGDQAPITSTGTVISGVYNFPLPTPITASRPFTLSYSGSGRLPPEWNDTAYSGQRTITSVYEPYYDGDAAFNAGSYDSSALVKVRNSTQASYYIMNGLSPQNNFGSNEIGKLCVITLLRGFMRAGEPANTLGAIQQVPLVNIVTPAVTDEFNNPSSISVSWTLAWNRWDGQPYTEQFPTNYTSTAPITYNVKYSNDNGRSWFYAQNGASATPGVCNPSYAATSPYSWDVSGLPRGSYILLVEAYRSNYQLHYTNHQRLIYIKR